MSKKIENQSKYQNEINKLKEEGNKIYFENLGDLVVEKIADICFIEDKNSGKLKSIGISICSLLDSYSRKEGRQRAFWRAKYSLDKKITTYPIIAYRYEWVGKFICRSRKIQNQSDIDTIYSNLKLVYNNIFSNNEFFDNNYQSLIKINDYNNKIYYKIPLNYCLIATKNNSYDYKSIYLEELSE